MIDNQETILESGRGLFGTHVLTEDVEQVVAEQLGVTATLGHNTRITVIGDGNGFMSRVLLVEADWSVSNVFLPRRFILKIASCLHVQTFVDKMKGKKITREEEVAIWTAVENEARQLHNREVNFYKILKTRQFDNSHVPQMYFYKKFDDGNRTKGFLGMEVVDDVTVRHMYTNVKPVELMPALKFVANLQVFGLHLTETEKSSISGYDFRHLLGSMMNVNGMKVIYRKTRNINPERLTEKCRKVQDFGLEVVNFELARNLNKYIGIEQSVMVHGDLWAANILWAKGGQGFEVAKIIDYQLIHMGNPAEDLVRLFMSTLSGNDRQMYWEKLLEQFYEYFLEALAENAVLKVPYSLAQLKESYRNYFVSGGLIMLPMYGPIAEMKLALSDKESVDDYREILTEKAEKLLEDLERWHLYSRETTRSIVAKL